MEPAGTHKGCVQRGNMRLLLLAFGALLQAGCAGVEAVRGDLHYDLRPAETRSELVWPSAPEQPRYRYVGELVGQPNFVPREDEAHDSRQKAAQVLKWLVGLGERDRPPALLSRPSHGMVARDGRIFVVDSGRKALFVFDPYAVDETGKTLDVGELQVWSRLGRDRQFGSPISVAEAWDGTIAVTDAELGTVVHLGPSGRQLAPIGAGQLVRPTGIAFDRATGLLYVADTATHVIKVFDRRGKLQRSIGGPGSGPGQFNAPTQLAFADGRLHVTDTLNSRVQRFDGEGRYLDHFGRRGTHLGDLARPKGLAVDPDGIVYVVESYFAHLLAFDGEGRFLLGIGGDRIAGRDLQLPSGVWTDDRSRVYVADMFNGRVVVFEFLGDGLRTDGADTETLTREAQPPGDPGRS